MSKIDEVESFTSWNCATAVAEARNAAVNMNKMNGKFTQVQDRFHILKCTMKEILPSFNGKIIS